MVTYQQNESIVLSLLLHNVHVRATVNAFVQDCLTSDKRYRYEPQRHCFFPRQKHMNGTEYYHYILRQYWLGVLLPTTSQSSSDIYIYFFIAHVIDCVSKLVLLIHYHCGLSSIHPSYFRFSESMLLFCLLVLYA